MDVRVTRTAALVLSAAVLAVGWWTLAPRQLGGWASYVTTSGTSMEPLLHAGDLAVVRRTGDYGVGDVVAYENAELGHVVLHRIVGFDGGRLVTKGDGNGWTDGYRPAPDELLGEMRVRVPGGGARLGMVRSPLGVAALAGAATLGVLGRRRRSRHGRTHGADRSLVRRRARHAATRDDASARARPGRSTALAFTLAGTALAVLGTAATAVATLLPATVAAPVRMAFDETGAFSYRADGGSEAVAVFGRPEIGSGEPVYRALADDVDLRYRYELRSPARPVEGSGTVSFDATVADGTGWSRSLPLAPVTSFSGSGVVVDGTLDLDAVERLTDAIARLSRVPDVTVSVTITARVVFDGWLGGEPIHRDTVSELAMTLDPVMLRVAPADPSAPSPADPFHVVSHGSVSRSREVPRRLGVGDLAASTGAVRATGLAAGAAGVLALAVAGLLRRRTARRGEGAAIVARYARWIVPAVSRTAPAGAVVDVGSFDALRRVAEHYGHLVLHERGDDGDRFSVEHDGVTYRYRAAAAPAR